MKMKSDYVLLQKVEKKESKIIIPDNAQEATKSKEIEIFLVKNVGPGNWESGKFIEPCVSKGDLVFITGFVSVIKDGEKFIFGRARDVVAVF